MRGARSQFAITLTVYRVREKVHFEDYVYVTVPITHSVKLNNKQAEWIGFYFFLLSPPERRENFSPEKFNPESSHVRSFMRPPADAAHRPARPINVGSPPLSSPDRYTAKTTPPVRPPPPGFYPFPYRGRRTTGNPRGAKHTVLPRARPDPVAVRTSRRPSVREHPS